MRTSLWMLTSMFAVTLAACGDDKGDTDTTGATVDTTTPGTTSTDPTTGTTDPTTSSTTTTTDPVTTDPVTTTTDPATTDPVTTDATTTTTTGDPVELTCQNYCGLYASGCSDFSEYANEQECLAQCAQWPLGIAGETAGDSLGCRLYHVGVANQTDPDVHCPHAGPTGDGVCVAADAPQCQNYCATYLKNCVDKLNLYKDEADCLGQCAAWYPGKDGDTTGDTVGCREYHAGVALGDPVTHCPHAGPGGAMICVAG